jgi:hypothetical protein
MRIHALASRIITNRTHSSILGAILRKPTTLLGGSCHKDCGVWEHSLARRGAQWFDSNLDAASRNAVTDPLPHQPVIGWLARKCATCYAIPMAIAGLSALIVPRVVAGCRSNL